MCRNGCGDAHIGDHYYFGTDEINTDLIQAYVWYSFAAAGGNKEATKQLQSLVNMLSQSQSGEAIRQTLDWKPGQCERDLMKAIPEENE
jgi:TPR repeat protein